VLTIGAVWCPALAPVALAVNLVAWGMKARSTILTGWGYGWQSSQFKQSLGAFAISTVFLGKGTLLTKFGAGPLGSAARDIGSHVSKVVTGAASTVVGLLSW